MKALVHTMSASSDPEPHSGPPPVVASRVPRLLSITLILALLAVLVSGIWFAQDRAQHLDYMAQEGLRSITALETAQIVQWRTERLADAAFLMDDPLLIATVADYLVAPQSAATTSLQALFRALQTHYHYTNITLVDAAGHIRLGMTDTTNVLHPEVQQAIITATQTRRALFTSLHSNPNSQVHHVDTIAPLFTTALTATQPLGSIIIETDTNQFFTTALQMRSIANTSTESYLVQRDGDAVLVLSDLRRQANAAFTLRMPLSDQTNPAVQAILYGAQNMRGQDYTGVPVFAVITAIPETPWFLIAQVDLAELEGTWRLQTVLIMGILLLIMLSVTSLLAMLWQRQARLQYQVLLQAETARAQAQRDLEKFAALADYSTEFIAMCDLAFVGSYLNPAGRKLVGLNDTSQEHQLPITAFFFPEDQPFITETFYPQVLREGHAEIEIRFRHFQTGAAIWMLHVLFAIRDVQGQPTGLATVSRNIAERKAAEAALQASEARYRAMFEQNAAIQLLIDPASGSIVDANPAAVRFYGYTRTTLLAMSISALNQLTPDEVYAEMHAARQELRNHFRFPHRLASGEIRTVEVFSGPVIIGERTLLYSIIHDDTERTHVEQALRASEEQFRTITEQLRDVVFMADRTSLITYISPAVQHLFGFQPAELIGQSFLTLLHEEEVPRLFALFDDALEQGDTMRRIELHMRRKDQSVFTGEVSGVYLKREGGAISLGVIRDITERKQAEVVLQAERALLAQRVAERTAELSRANAELAYALRTKDEFLANMSHELRTPLNAILGLTESLEEAVYGPLTTRQSYAISIIEQSGRHLLSLINDILDLAKIEAGKLELQPERIVVTALCQASLRFVHEAALKKSVQVTFQFSDSELTLHADARRLTQILVNLLSNAVKFTPAGGHVSLTVTPDAEQGALRFIVQDSGIGIPANALGRLFTPFTQLDSSLARQYEGTGLGLVLVRRLVDLHGGSVQAESAGVPGQGSCFIVSIPWQEGGVELPVLVEPRPVAAAPDETATGLSQASLASILLVEDNAANSKTISDYLTYHGYTVLLARDGGEGLHQAYTTCPALILMDIQLPVLDGLQVIRRLRSEARFGTTPIIALTALTTLEDRQRCLAAGANDYLSKPVSLIALITLIEAYLKQQTEVILPTAKG